MALPFLKEERVGLRDQLTFKGNKLDIFLPSYFLEETEGIATIMGDKVETIGLFWFKVDNKFYEMQIPVKIIFGFSERSKKKMSLQQGIPDQEYDVFTLVNGDPLVNDLNYKQSVDDLTFFISKLLEGGKMPDTVSYNEVFSLYLKAMQITSIMKLGISSVTLEFMLSEMFRNRRNLNQPFRLAYNGKNITEYDYRLLRIVKIPELNSTFTSLLGEDIKQQLISSVLRTREGKKDRVSPIEKIIKY
jgi:hypothetical protein